MPVLRQHFNWWCSASGEDASPVRLGWIRMLMLSYVPQVDPLSMHPFLFTPPTTLAPLLFFNVSFKAFLHLTNPFIALKWSSTSDNPLNRLSWLYAFYYCRYFYNNLLRIYFDFQKIFFRIATTCTYRRVAPWPCTLIHIELDILHLRHCWRLRIFRKIYWHG